jgi:cbb3-type cytochrome oxidase maturation protein
MSVLILLIIFSLLLAVGFLLAFIWSIKDNQMEDDYTPSVRILFDNEIIESKDNTETTNQNL